MSIEIKELVIRAIVDTQAENQESKAVEMPQQQDTMAAYLESLMNNQDNKQER